MQSFSLTAKVSTKSELPEVIIAVQKFLISMSFIAALVYHIERWKVQKKVIYKRTFGLTNYDCRRSAKNYSIYYGDRALVSFSMSKVE